MTTLFSHSWLSEVKISALPEVFSVELKSFRQKGIEGRNITQCCQMEPGILQALGNVLTSV